MDKETIERIKELSARVITLSKKIDQLIGLVQGG